MKVAPISDTHELLRPEVAGALAGAMPILHADDAGKLPGLDIQLVLEPADGCARRADDDLPRPPRFGREPRIDTRTLCAETIASDRLDASRRALRSGGRTRSIRIKGSAEPPGRLNGAARMRADESQLTG